MTRVICGHCRKDLAWNFAWWVWLHTDNWTVYCDPKDTQMVAWPIGGDFFHG